MIFFQAIKSFRRLASAGELRDRKTGQLRRLSPSRQRVVVSNTRAALAVAAGVSRDETDTIVLDPYAASLVDVARAAAASAGRASPRNEAANVALFLSAVLGEWEDSSCHGYANRRPVTEDRVLPAWRPLYDALRELAEEEDTKRTFPAQLVAFQDLALRNGVGAPCDVPDDFDAISEWSDTAGHDRSKFSAMAAAFRTARLRLNDLSLPTFYQRVRAGERGVRSLPDLKERLRKAKCEGDPIGIPTVDIVRWLAPKMGMALDRHLESGRRRHRSPSWIEAQIGMASRFVAELIRQGYDPAALTWVDLFERTVEVEGSGQPDDLLSEVLGSGYVHVERISLYRFLVEQSARKSAESSPLDLINADAADDGSVPFYTNKIQQDAMYGFMLTRMIYGEAMERSDRQRWESIAREYDSLRADMSAQNEVARTRGQKARDQILLLWPQAIFLGLADLRREVLEAEARKDAFEVKRGHFNTQTGRRLLKEFDLLLKEYVLAAVLLDDGLRIKNYAGALAGEHFIPEVRRDRDGRWTAFDRVQTSFRGYDAFDVSLKVARDELERERSRKRYLTPGILDHRLFFEYWTQSRPRDLVRRGSIGSVEEFDPDEDCYAVFVAPRPGGRRKIRRTAVDERAKRSGRYTGDQLSKIFGRVLHWMVRDILGRDVPEWEDPARTTEWRGLFAAHITRALLATYFGGIRGNWVYACEVTDDREITLRRNYVRIRSTVVAKMHQKGPENPHHFDEVVDRMLDPREGDNWDAFWAVFDPLNPTAALAALDQAIDIPRPRGKRRRPKSAA